MRDRDSTQCHSLSIGVRTSAIQFLLGLSLVCYLCLAYAGIAHAHHDSAEVAQKKRDAAAARDEANSEMPAAELNCQLTLSLVDAESKQVVPGLVRLINTSSDKAIRLPDLIQREQNWFVITAPITVSVPRVSITVEAFQGLETTLAKISLDLTDKDKAELSVPLKQFYDVRQQGLRAGNTHLHLMKMSHTEAYEYLRDVPRADDLDLVFLSHLRRIPDERDYISNEIVESSFAGGTLARLSREGVLFSNGEEHRHNFDAGGEGYGHVMLLNIPRLIRPISIGPGIMKSGTDGRPLQQNIKQAKADGATVIWCHNAFGLEDLPNWVGGMIQAQNIFDGSERGGYEDSFYKYLNLGLHVPFSTGTDWGIYDFSRVYVPVEGEFTSEKWLASLIAGRSYITNGTHLQFQVDGHKPGDVIHLDKPQTLIVRAQATGRANFSQLELIHNGRVVRHVNSEAVDGHFTASMEHKITIEGPGWLAVRIPTGGGFNEFGKKLFAHSSPVYIEFKGQRIFDESVATALLEEMKQSITTINKTGTFANDEERGSVLQVHAEGVRTLQTWIAKGSSARE